MSNPVLYKSEEYRDTFAVKDPYEFPEKLFLRFKTPVVELKGEVKFYKRNRIKRLF